MFLFQTEFRELLFFRPKKCLSNKPTYGSREDFLFSLGFMPRSVGFDGSLWNKKEIAENIG